MTIVTSQAVSQADWDAMREFVGSSDCSVGMKMMFHGSVCNALARRFSAHRQAFLTEILDHLTTEHSGAAQAIRERFGTPADRATDCPSSPDGRHQVDTSMESGPNNCFHCEAPMPRFRTSKG